MTSGILSETSAESQATSGQEAGERVQFGEFVLEPSLQRLTRGGSVIPLKPKAYDLLCLLMSNRERVIGKNELLDWLWPRQEIVESNLSQAIYELRRALEDNAQNPKWIETVPRRGYRFIGELHTLAGPDLGSAMRSLAIMPFVSLDADDDQSHWSLGIADVLITALSSSDRLVVRPLSAVLRYSAQSGDALAAARELGVDVVLEGSFQFGSAGLRINARLLRKADGTCLEAWRFVVNGNDPFEVENEICNLIAPTVAARLTGSEAAKQRVRHTEDPEVHIASIKGRYCWHKWTNDAWLEAVRHFQHALRLQPDHSPSLAGLAAAWSTLGIFGACPPREAFSRAREAASQAVTLAPSDPQGHEIMGAIHLFHDWDLIAASQCLDRAIELAPDRCNARHLRALTLAYGGVHSPALAEINRALQCDPHSLITRTDLGIIHFWGRRYQAAEKVFREVLKRDPSFAHARRALAETLAEQGEIHAAIEQMEMALADFGLDHASSGEMAFLLGRAARTDDARRVIDRLEKKYRQDYIDPFQLVLAYLGAGDPEGYFPWLDIALSNRSRDLLVLNIHPALDALRTQSRFIDFLERAGLNWQLNRTDSRSPESGRPVCQ